MTEEKLTISVCMATYNGEKYIGEQLRTIYEQTRPADEVIICDDGSRDRTTELVRDFIAEHGLEEQWKLYVNDDNKGYPGNFYYACSLCTKDLVFLADQDDVWAADKLERMAVEMERENKILVLCCKFGLMDSAGENIHSMMNPTRNHGTGGLKRISSKDVFFKCEWPGMVLAYRRPWFEKQIPDRSSIPHDFRLCARAAEEGGFFQLDEELAWHRRHDSNAGGEEHRILKLLNKRRKIGEVQDYLKTLEAFEEEDVMKTPGGEAALQEKLFSMRSRLKALESGSFKEVIVGAWNYRHLVRPATLICDLLIVKSKR